MESLDRGLSSETIWGSLSGEFVPGPSYRSEGSIPYDSDDLGRCIRLLDLIPEWRKRLTELSKAFPEWEPIVNNWERLEERYRKGERFSIKEGKPISWEEPAKEEPAEEEPVGSLEED